LVDYQQGFSLQEKLLASRKSGAISDVLLLLEHPSVLTVGHTGADENIIVPAEALVEEGIPVFYTNRGGDVTYHGPGQIVGYPILNLRENGLTVHQYIWDLEEVVIRTLADYGIDGQRVKELRGVWVGGREGLFHRRASQRRDHHAWLRVKCEHRFKILFLYCALRHHRGVNDLHLKIIRT